MKNTKEKQPLIVQAAKAQTGHPLKNLLLIYLADYWSEEKGAFPSYGTLAERCGGRTTRRHVINMMNELEADGWIVKDRQFTTDGLSKSNKYRLIPYKLGVNTEHYPSEDSSLPQCSEFTTLVKTVHPKSLLKSPIEKPIENNPYSFDAFYAAYPKKVGRREAEKAWRKLDPPPQLIERIMRDIKERVEQGAWCIGEGKQYIPGPAPYLNQHRWEDDIIPRPEFQRANPKPINMDNVHDLTEKL